MRPLRALMASARRAFLDSPEPWFFFRRVFEALVIKSSITGMVSRIEVCKNSVEVVGSS